MPILAFGCVIVVIIINIFLLFWITYFFLENTDITVKPQKQIY